MFVYICVCDRERERRGFIDGVIKLYYYVYIDIPYILSKRDVQIGAFEVRKRKRHTKI